MDETKFAADFIAKNIKDIFKLGRKAFGKLDDTVKLKLKTAYAEYLKNTEEKYSKAKSFFIRNHAVNLYDYYVPISINSSSKVLTEPSFGSVIKCSNRLVISGTGGCGKSVLMRHLFLDCIKVNKFVPILIELRDLNKGDYSLDELILSNLETFGFNVSSDFIHKAKLDGHFALFLDGYEEVKYILRKKTVDSITKFALKYSKCTMIISTRPDDVFKGIDEFDIYQVSPLTLNSAIDLISKLPCDGQIKNHFINDLKRGLYQQHYSFLSNPLLLSIMLLTYGEYAQIPSKLSIFYNQAYETLFRRHDAAKGLYVRERLTSLDIQEFAKVFSYFSLYTYNKNSFKMSEMECIDIINKSKRILDYEFKDEDYLSDLLTSVCLLVKDGLEITYTHRSFQEYFVALYILTAHPDMQEKLVQKYFDRMYSDIVITLLLEMNPELVERVLYIPVLQELFDFLGVKQKVRITHLLKFIKRFFQHIFIFSDCSYTYEVKLSEYRYVYVLKHVMSNYSEFIDFRDNIDKKYLRELYEKFHDESESVYSDEVVFTTYSMRSKSPILTILSKTKAAYFSLYFLQCGFDAFNNLKDKHANETKEIEKLFE